MKMRTWWLLATAEEGLIVDIRGEQPEAPEKDSRLNHAMREEREGGVKEEERGRHAEKEKNSGRRSQESGKPGAKNRGVKEHMP